jgi:hypothetical protein
LATQSHIRRKYRCISMLSSSQLLDASFRATYLDDLFDTYWPMFFAGCFVAVFGSVDWRGEISLLGGVAKQTPFATTLQPSTPTPNLHHPGWRRCRCSPMGRSGADATKVADVVTRGRGAGPVRPASAGLADRRRSGGTAGHHNRPTGAWDCGWRSADCELRIMVPMPEHRGLVGGRYAPRSRDRLSLRRYLGSIELRHLQNARVEVHHRRSHPHERS